jgi:hypothetical protein
MRRLGLQRSRDERLRPLLVASPTRGERENRAAEPPRADRPDAHCCSSPDRRDIRTLPGVGMRTTGAPRLITLLSPPPAHKDLERTRLTGRRPPWTSKGSATGSWSRTRGPARHRRESRGGGGSLKAPARFHARAQIPDRGRPCAANRCPHVEAPGHLRDSWSRARSTWDRTHKT